MSMSLEGIAAHIEITQVLYRYTNVLIRLDGDVAAVESYYLAIHAVPGGMVPAAGRYLDRFERRAGEWRIARRKVIIDWTQQASSAPPWPRQVEFLLGRRRSEDASFPEFAWPVEH